MNIHSTIKKFIYALKVFIINFIILYLLLFIGELYFQLTSNNLFSESKYIKREKLIKKYNETVHLAFAPYKLLNKNNELLPLSGISNTRTLLCEDDIEYIEYFSDNYGFNNTSNIKDKEILIIGDSYVHGLCLKREDIFSSKFDSINLAMQANGPLIQYATYKEYAHIYNFNKLIWVFTPDNDFYDFNKETKNNILLKYLDDKNYSQNLIKKDNIKNKIIENYFNYRERKFKETIKHYHLDLKYIRSSISKLIDEISFKNKKVNDETYKIEYYNTTLKDIKNILNRVNNDLKEQGKEFLVVFNAIHPMYKYPKSSLHREHYKGIILGTKKIKQNLELNSISFIDFEDFVSSNFNENNIDYIFKKKNGGYDHYTIEGNKIIAEQIKDYLK